LLVFVFSPMALGLIQQSWALRGIVLSSCFSALTVWGAEVSSLVEKIPQCRQLPQDQQEWLTGQLSRKNWKKLSPSDRKKVQLACYQASQNLIGKNDQGKLKVVKNSGEKQILKVAGDYLNSLPPEEVPAHPSAGDLFGEISVDAKLVSRKVTIDPMVVRWHSTGLYAKPGEVVTLKFPSAWVGKGLKVHVSGHRDNISIKKSLKRLPTRPFRSFSVDEPTIKVAGAFGGAIYIDTGSEQREGKPFQVQISHALQAPYFVLGKTKVATWKNFLRQAPAPYAEMVTSRIALSFPSAWVRDIEDPTALLQYWDRVVALHDELGGMAHTRFGPERVNVDVQISVGLFHAGYPAQGPQKQCRGVVDLEKLKKQGNWGWFHEMGHESQRRPDKAWGWNNPYTFDGSVEATVNLFSTHAMDRMQMSNRGGWSWTASPKEVEKRAHQIMSGKKRYPELGAGDKLTMYLQLRDAFGWKTIQKMLTSYSDDQNHHPEKLPKENQAKRDAFLVRMSQASGHNLTPFLQDLWGIQMSPEAVEKVKNLPAWMPEGFKS